MYSQLELLWHFWISKGTLFARFKPGRILVLRSSRQLVLRYFKFALLNASLVKALMWFFEYCCLMLLAWIMVVTLAVWRDIK